MPVSFLWTTLNLLILLLFDVAYALVRAAFTLM
jgi:hypothetical protein